MRIIQLVLLATLEITEQYLTHLPLREFCTAVLLYNTL